MRVTRAANLLLVLCMLAPKEIEGLKNSRQPWRREQGCILLNVGREHAHGEGGKTSTRVLSEKLNVLHERERAMASIDE
eukprot:CAMPEP_0183366388 /NCGR_PEP_ID=MMETSP0164_2-20130417/88453_1 /TAXON_ID=221442 /ORGANISM="Coccolithus pelagicus ssp braarudi, Strain PLY182g" /LENGTH=78 /DNA_ID=CAMNT_0025542107 /DNA_START=459 /DNA_END=695 /DNA_ORIENTATION=-